MPCVDGVVSGALIYLIQLRCRHTIEDGRTGRRAGSRQAEDPASAELWPGTKDQQVVKVEQGWGKSVERAGIYPATRTEKRSEGGLS
nr:hypothetical protein CFP56_04485 [Quercus suber]